MLTTQEATQPAHFLDRALHFKITLELCLAVKSEKVLRRELKWNDQNCSALMQFGRNYNDIFPICSLQDSQGLLSPYEQQLPRLETTQKNASNPLERNVLRNVHFFTRVPSNA